MQNRRQFIKTFNFDENKKPVGCRKARTSEYSTSYACRKFKKSTLKKFNEFKNSIFAPIKTNS